MIFLVLRGGNDGRCGGAGMAGRDIDVAVVEEGLERSGLSFFRGGNFTAGLLLAT
jgi:hypothetical protein